MAHISGVTTAARGAAHAWAPGGADSAKKRKHGKSRKVHPDARAGGGGPGHFRIAYCTISDEAIERSLPLFEKVYHQATA